jgi:excisionase family DNA binding protein
MAKKVYTPEEAVSYLGLDREGLSMPLEALRWLCRTGRLRFTRIGRHIRFEEAWLDELIEKNAVMRSESHNDVVG